MHDAFDGNTGAGASDCFIHAPIVSISSRYPCTGHGAALPSIHALDCPWEKDEEVSKMRDRAFGR